MLGCIWSLKLATKENHRSVIVGQNLAFGVNNPDGLFSNLGNIYVSFFKVPATLMY